MSVSYVGANLKPPICKGGFCDTPKRALQVPKSPFARQSVGLGTSSVLGRVLHRQPRVGSPRPQEKVPRPAGVGHLHKRNLHSLPKTYAVIAFGQSIVSLYKQNMFSVSRIKELHTQTSCKTRRCWPSGSPQLPPLLQTPFIHLHATYCIIQCATCCLFDSASELRARTLPLRWPVDLRAWALRARAPGGRSAGRGRRLRLENWSRGNQGGGGGDKFQIEGRRSQSHCLFSLQNTL